MYLTEFFVCGRFICVWIRLCFYLLIYFDFICIRFIYLCGYVLK